MRHRNHRINSTKESRSLNSITREGYYDTRSLVVYAGKLHWVQPREDMVKAKGRGVFETHSGWDPSVEVNSSRNTSSRVTATIKLPREISRRWRSSPRAWENRSRGRLLKWMVEDRKRGSVLIAGSLNSM
jgi:hypothetical protein